MRKVQVSRASAAFLSRGHPWLRRDRWTRGLEGLSCGEAVCLVDERSRPLASALADPEADICARVYDRRPDQAFAADERLIAAWQRRRRLHEDAQTDAYRLVHGEADGLPGLRVERYGSDLVLVSTAAVIRAYLPTIVAALQQCGDWRRMLHKEQDRDLRQGGLRLTELGRAGPDAVVVQERGLVFHCRPFEELATGLYVDQRATRDWLAGRCERAQVANLFAYTGAFSMAALEAGASRAVDVDIAGPSLAIGRENAVLNGVSDRYEQARQDCLAWCQRQPDGAYDIVVCDPPTAARGKRGWVARRDYPVLLAELRRIVKPGGVLVATSNTLGKRMDLAALVEESGFVREAGPEMGIDIPLWRGFPEGRPYQLACGRRG